MTNIAINGIGRIGKLVLKLLISNDYKVTYLNELNGNHSSLLHSLEFDSIHGKWDASFKLDNEKISINKKVIQSTFSKNIENLDLNNIDILIDCTGAHNNSSDLKKYFDKGVKKVVVSAPVNEENIANIAYGVNQNIYNPNKHDIITAASCTTNCIAPIIKVIHENIGIVHGSITTVSYTHLRAHETS